ncbi:MAG: DUF1801 domain-containing protein [Candidatus Eisenbacteria bacterium]|nr:DUF1801 domain-containing protein [Candidatus Eisenbacteria bacterium]
MKPGSAVPLTITEYIAAAAPEARAVLRKLRAAIRKAAPDADEVISYRMPAFRQGGILLYFAAFQEHIGVFPPVRGDEALMKALAPYAGPKGNLRFPLDEPFPYALLTRIAKLRVKQEAAKAAKRPAKKKR